MLTHLILSVLMIGALKCGNEIDPSNVNPENQNQMNARQSRSNGMNAFGPCFLKDNATSTVVRVFFTILFVLLGLIVLGLIKAFFGLYGLRGIGMFGLDRLIDLPRPLDYYQEPHLMDTPVQYDIAGWPVHPDTKQRSVRVISKRTEFCANVIFFLTYPMVLCIHCCTLCFSTYDDEVEDDKCFQSINKIIVAGCPPKKKCTNVNTYNDEDNDEEEDTKYVLNEMKRSEECLKAKCKAKR